MFGSRFIEVEKFDYLFDEKKIFGLKLIPYLAIYEK